jgi:hypothetical protein
MAMAMRMVFPHGYIRPEMVYIGTMAIASHQYWIDIPQLQSNSSSVTIHSGEEILSPTLAIFHNEEDEGAYFPSSACLSGTANKR